MSILSLVNPSLLLDHFLPLPITPFAQLDLQRTTSKPTLIHLAYGTCAILGIHETDEAVASGLAGILLEHYTGHMK